MSTFEELTLVIQAAQVLALLGGFWFAGRQLRQAQHELHALKETHRQNHDFQRRQAAQQAVNDFNYSNLSADLISVFKYTDKNEVLDLTSIDSELARNAEARTKLIMLFRHYEGLARGINCGIYDESVVKSAHRTTLTRFARIFRAYIEDRRLKLNPRLWIEFTELADRWASEDRLVHAMPKTGHLD